MKFLDWIRGHIVKKPVSALETQRDALTLAIQQTEEELDRLSCEAVDDGVCICCIGASYGGTEGVYCKLEAKLDRQYAWLEILNGKLK